MKRTCIALAALLAVSVCCAAGFSDAPESSIPTPAESGSVNRDAPDIGVKEKADWQKLREERREAREQILQRLKNSAEEKNALRENTKTQRNPKAAIANENPIVPPHERNGLNPMINPSADKMKEHPMIMPPGHLKDNRDRPLGRENSKPEKDNLVLPVHP